MKKINLIIAAVAAFALLIFSGNSNQASAQDLSSILGAIGADTGVSSGQRAGAALKSLYTQYKKDGKLNMTNLTNITNVTTLANSIQGLKGQKLTSAFCKDFAKGLVTGSNSTITSSNSTSVTNALSKLASNSAIEGLIKKAESNTTTTANKIENASKIASSVTSILKMIK